MAHPRLDRRALLAGLGGAALAGCAADPEPAGSRATDAGEAPVTSGPQRITYGDDPSQWVDVHTPGGTSRGLVVVIHGGFWKAEYGAEYGAPLAEDLAGRGWTAANVEYRRVGNGGGFPETLDDVHAALGAVVRDADGPVDGPVVALGHSAGGHLATWAAARGRFDRWADGPALTHVVSQAGVLDLRAAVADGLGTDAARAFLGDAGESAYSRVDPLAQVPLDVPVWAVHATDDDVVPFSQATTYVDAATAAGAAATLVEVSGGHFGVIEPTSEAWAACVAVLDAIG
ncbi:acetyl esterase/lipase [Nocardioides cavernae]|uniref:Acetyl esterase/lipase n=1 Tax=Nocardioides cavernae TaxID=1921566 RepID=A0A7Y9KS12_9ACTN|nr:alpha/beta hydrolase [Nocardioides cavernae]NYE35937.1 acetyl esterase/lipase [Nocardioides cavernae]